MDECLRVLIAVGLTAIVAMSAYFAIRYLAPVYG